MSDYRFDSKVQKRLDDYRESPINTSRRVKRDGEGGFTCSYDEGDKVLAVHDFNEDFDLKNEEEDLGISCYLGKIGFDRQSQYKSDIVVDLFAEVAFVKRDGEYIIDYEQHWSEGEAFFYPQIARDEVRKIVGKIDNPPPSEINRNNASDLLKEYANFKWY